MDLTTGARELLKLTFESADKALTLLQMCPQDRGTLMGTPELMGISYLVRAASDLLLEMDGHVLSSRAEEAAVALLNALIPHHDPEGQ